MIDPMISYSNGNNYRSPTFNSTSGFDITATPEYQDYMRSQYKNLTAQNRLRDAKASGYGTAEGMDAAQRLAGLGRIAAPGAQRNLNWLNSFIIPQQESTLRSAVAEANPGNSVGRADAFRQQILGQIGERNRQLGESLVSKGYGPGIMDSLQAAGVNQANDAGNSFLAQSNSPQGRISALGALMDLLNGAGSNMQGLNTSLNLDNSVLGNDARIVQGLNGKKSTPNTLDSILGIAGVIAGFL